jgi:hypothetical protein
MPEFKVFFQAVREGAGEDGAPRREERMVSYAIEAPDSQQASQAARARFDLELGGAGWAVEAMGMLNP